MTTLSVLSPPSRIVDDIETRPRYSLVVTSDREHRVAAQRLRYDVFATEPGFDIPVNEARLDADRFDDHCDHLLVRDDVTDEFVGCYRMLPPDAAKAAGGYYTATEFDLSDLAPLRPQVVEMGRACVRPEHRNGTVLSLMWAGILHYIQLTGYEWVMGCVSVPMQETPADLAGRHVRGVRDVLRAKHASPYAARPYNPVVVDGLTLDDMVAPIRPKMPPLLKGYLRLGATTCGEPAHDPDFGVADFVALLGLHQVNRRYLERLQEAAAALDATSVR